MLVETVFQQVVPDVKTESETDSHLKKKGEAWQEDHIKVHLLQNLHLLNISSGQKPSWNTSKSTTQKIATSNIKQRQKIRADCCDGFQAITMTNNRKSHDLMVT